MWFFKSIVTCIKCKCRLRKQDSHIVKDYSRRIYTEYNSRVDKKIYYYCQRDKPNYTVIRYVHDMGNQVLRGFRIVPEHEEEVDDVKNIEQWSA